MSKHVHHKYVFENMRYVDAIHTYIHTLEHTHICVY